MEPKRIVIDGKTYTSVQEMPPDVRQQYEQAMGSLRNQTANRIPDVLEDNNILADRNRNGIPDVVENTPGESIVANTMKILFDGKEFDRLEDLPPEARAKYEQAIGKLDVNRNGMPDFLEGMIRVQSSAPPVSTGFGTESSATLPRTPMSIESPTITPDTPNPWLLGLLAALILFLCLVSAVAGWYFLLR